MSVLDNVLASGLLVSKNKRAIVAKAKSLLTEVGLTEAAWSKFPAQLSGGEAQRAGIVRALINSPKIIFADEPTGALNSAASDSVLDVMTAVNQNGQSIVMVTHDIKTALRGTGCSTCVMASFVEISNSVLIMWNTTLHGMRS